MSSSEPTRISFFFDPICPWTWLTYRWLESVSAQIPLEVEWRSMSLSVLNKDKEIEERFKPALASSTRFLRVLESIRRQSVADPKSQLAMESKLEELYRQSGILRFETEGHSEEGWLETAIEKAGLDPELLAAADDSSWDEQVTFSTDKAMELAGPDVGSPVIRFGDDGHGFHGPIIDGVPGPEDSLKIWALLEQARGIPAFHEIKRGRKGPPNIPKESSAGD